MTATLDILTIDEARAAIGVGLAQTYDDLLESWVTAVSLAMDTRYGPTVNRTVTERHDAYGYCTIIPFELPVYSFTSVTEYQSGTGTVLTAETDTAAGTYLWERNLLRRRESFRDSYFRGRVKLVYVAGEAADTESVPAGVKTAARVILEHNWTASQGSGNQTFGDVPVGAKGFAFPNRADELMGRRVIPGIA